MTELGRGALVQLRVLHALALRETRTRYGEHQLGYVWALLEPILWVATFWGMYFMAGRVAPGDTTIVPFLATGIIPFELVTKTADRVTSAVAGNKAMLFYPQVQPLDLVAARMLLESATSGVVFAIILGGWALWTGEFEPPDPLLAAFGLLLAALLGGAFGTLLCATTVVFPTIERIKGPLMRPLFWTSGIFFSVESLPTIARDVLLWNPVLHCVEMVRSGWLPGHQFRHAEPGYVVAWILGLAYFGLTLERVVRPKIELS